MYSRVPNVSTLNVTRVHMTTPLTPPLHIITPFPAHRHVCPDPQEVPVAGSTLALDEVVAESIAVGESVEHVLPVCAGKHIGPSMCQLPAHERLVGREPGGGAEEGVGQSRGKRRGRRKEVLSRSWSLMTKHTAKV